MKPNQYSLPPTDSEFIEGGGFMYENCPAIFLGRAGCGPLRVAWDSNILIDFAAFGDLMWDDREFDPPISEPRYRTELVALDALVQLWMMRDIRIRAPERQIDDCRRQLNEAQWNVRFRQLHQILAALTCIELDREVLANVQPFDTLPHGSSGDDWDESLVLEAIATGCHVFLTRDARLRRRLGRAAREAFMVIMPPSDLHGALLGAGEAAFGGIDGYIFPDNHKWIHFMNATKNSED